MSQITVSTNNTTIVPLGAGATFVGLADETLSYQEVDINIAGTPTTGAPGTLIFEFSPDGINWDISIARDVPTLPFIPLTLRIILPFFRVQYINGPVPLAAFRLTTVYHVFSSTRLTRFPDQPIDLNEPTQSVRVAPLGINRYIQARAATNAILNVACNATVYTEQAAGAQRSISSTSPLDTAAGVGARSVRITYYTLTAGVVEGPFTEVVVLNGVLPVNTVASNICYISKMETVTVGVAGATNAGILQLWTLAGGLGLVFCSVAVGDLKTFLGVHYVPTEKILTLISVRITSTAAAANEPTFTFRQTPLGTGATNAAYDVVAAGLNVQGSSGAREFVFGPARVVNGPARLQVFVLPTNAAAQVQQCTADFYET